MCLKHRVEIKHAPLTSCCASSCSLTSSASFSRISAWAASTSRAARPRSAVSSRSTCVHHMQDFLQTCHILLGDSGSTPCGLGANATQCSFVLRSARARPAIGEETRSMSCAGMVLEIAKSDGTGGMGRLRRFSPRPAGDRAHLTLRLEPAGYPETYRYPAPQSAHAHPASTQIQHT